MLRAPGTISTVLWSLVRGTGRPFGVEVVGDPAQVFARGGVEHPFRPLIRWITTRNLRKQCREAFATAYVTERQLQLRYPPDPDRFTVSCSDVELKDEHFSARPRTDFCDNGVQRIIMVGTFGQMYKGQDILLNALPALAARGINFEVVFIGDGKFRPEMERLAQSLRLYGKTKFLGELPAGDAVRAELDRAHLFVMPSRTEGLPRAMIEAMARGLPCIGAGVGGIPELLPLECLIPANDPLSLGNKLVEVLQSPTEMTKMSRENLARAERFRNSLMLARRNEFFTALAQGTTDWLQHESSLSDSRPS